VPRKSLDAAKNLPKEAPRQVALGQLEHEVPRMPDQPPAGLEESLLETRQGLALDGDRQNEPRTSFARNRWQESRVQWVASLPSLIHCSAVPRWV
jgi:hypothetical protein